VEVHGVGLRTEVGKPEMSSDFSACGLCLDQGHNRKEPDHFLFADKSLGITLSGNATSWGV